MPTRTTVYTAETARAVIEQIQSLIDQAITHDHEAKTTDTLATLHAIVLEAHGSLTSGAAYAESKAPEPANPLSSMLWHSPDASAHSKLVSLASHSLRSSENKEASDSAVLLLKICAALNLFHHEQLNKGALREIKQELYKSYPVASTAEVVTGTVLCGPSLLASGVTKTADFGVSILGAVFFPAKALKLVTLPADKLTDWTTSASGRIAKNSFWSAYGYLNLDDLWQLVAEYTALSMLRKPSSYRPRAEAITDEDKHDIPTGSTPTAFT